jgi:hypothetical protein
MGFSTSLDSPLSLGLLLLLRLPFLKQLEMNQQDSSSRLQRACHSLARLL